MAIFVGVAHDLCRFSKDQVEWDATLRKHFLLDPTAQPVQVVKKATALSARKEESEGEPIEGFPTAKVTWPSCDDLPEAALSAEAIVVSPLYAAAWRATHPGEDAPFYGVLNPVCVREKSNQTKIVGCLGLQPL